jgi:hypothetical protein
LSTPSPTIPTAAPGPEDWQRGLLVNLTDALPMIWQAMAVNQSDALI